MRSVGEDDVSLDRFEVRLQSLNQLDESNVKNKHAVLSVVGNVGEILGKEARVEGVADSSNAHDTIPANELANGQVSSALAQGVIVNLLTCRNPSQVLTAREEHTRPPGAELYSIPALPLDLLA